LQSMWSAHKNAFEFRTSPGEAPSSLSASVQSPSVWEPTSRKQVILLAICMWSV
jgi:hypothetical protein